MTSLGIVLFHALDYGLCDDEERTLSKPLELLIERLTTAEELARRQRKCRQGARTNSDQLHSIGSLYEDDNGDDEEDDDEDEDECANADEGIERDCHEYNDPQSTSLQLLQLVNFDQVMQVGLCKHFPT